MPAACACELIHLCAQSNIDTILVGKALNGPAEVSACDDAAKSPAAVRLFRVSASGDTQHAWARPQLDVGAGAWKSWQKPNSTACALFSATCWFAARDWFKQLGGQVPVGVIMSAAGGTAVRNWAPMEALAQCPQPYNSPHPYGIGPYEQSRLYNGMIAPFGTGPTRLSFVIWDQAESDSYPQTPRGYYGCQTVAQINGWRRVLQRTGSAKAGVLPWVFVALQPYTGSDGTRNPQEKTCGVNTLAWLRADQLQALQLDKVGYANAVDLGDPTSPYGNVHFQNKQEITRRLVGAATVLLDPTKRSKSGAAAYPPPRVFNQTRLPTTGGSIGVVVQLLTMGYGAPSKPSLALGATPDALQPGTTASSAVCPACLKPPCKQLVPAANCSNFELLGSDMVWRKAAATLVGVDSVRLVAGGVSNSSTYAVGSRYAWSAWPLATLFSANEDGTQNLPILPWSYGTIAMPPK